MLMLKEYIKQWNETEGVKPKNEEVFLDLFASFLEDEDVVTIPDGEGSYFGKQCIVEQDSRWAMTPGPRFEVAYDFLCPHNGQKISIYTANHNGFWNPEYAVLTKDSDGFYRIRDLLKKKLLDYIGLEMN